MDKINLRWEDNTSPDIDAHNLQLMTDGINDLIDETENIENRLSEIQSSVVVANPTGKPKKILDTIAIDGTVYKVEGGESEKYEVLKLQNGNTPVLVDVPSNTTGIYVAEIREDNDKKYYAGSVYIDLDTKMANVCPDEVNLAIYNKYLGQYWEDSNGYIYDLRKVSDVKFEIVYYFDSYTNISAIEFNSEWTKAEMNSGDYGTSALAIAYIKGSGDIGVTSWEDLENKPFESLNADNFEVDENGKLSVIGGGGDVSQLEQRVERLEDDVDSLERYKVTQLTFNTGIDIGDWDSVIDPDEPVIYEKYVNYHDAVAKLSQQIDIMGARTDTLKTSLNAPYELIGQTNSGTNLTLSKAIDKFTELKIVRAITEADNSRISYSDSIAVSSIVLNNSRFRYTTNESNSNYATTVDVKFINNNTVNFPYYRMGASIKAIDTYIYAK